MGELGGPYVTNAGKCSRCLRPIGEHPYSKTYGGIYLFGFQCAYNPEHKYSARVALQLEKDGYDATEFEKFWNAPPESAK